MKKAEDDEIRALYEDLRSVWRVAEALDMCGQSIHGRLKSMGVDTSKRGKWTEDQIAHLKDCYQDYADAGKLDELADFYGRNKGNVCRKARSLGLTNKSRKRPYISDDVSDRSRKWHAENEHPRGMKGKRHTEETRSRISESSLNMWKNMSEEEISDWVMKGAKTRERNGTMVGKNREKASWKAAWREIGGSPKYYRSRWEANYARYLESLLQDGGIKEWLHEPETFWFDGIKRGCVSYLPDFKVTHKDGSIEYHEVKGWMDNRSKTKLKRMAKYHPDVTLVLIDSKAYRNLEKEMKDKVDGWEA